MKEERERKDIKQKDAQKQQKGKERNEYHL